MKSINIFVLTLLLSATLTQKIMKKSSKKVDVCAMDAVLHMSKAGQNLAFKLTNTQISALSSEYHEHVPGDSFETHVITQTIVVHQAPVRGNSLKLSMKNDFLQKEINKELKYLNELAHHVAVLENQGKKIGKKSSKKPSKKCLIYKFNHKKAETRLSCLSRKYNFSQKRIPYYRFCSKWSQGKCVKYSVVRKTTKGSPVVYCKTFMLIKGKKTCTERGSFIGKSKYRLRCNRYGKVIKKKKFRVVKKSGKLGKAKQVKKSVKHVGCLSFSAYRIGKSSGRKLRMRALRTVYKSSKKKVEVHKVEGQYSSVLFKSIGKFTKTDAAFIEMCKNK